MKKYKNSELSFVVVDSIEDGINAWITPTEFFEKNGYLCDQHLKTKIKKWEQIMECCFSPIDKTLTLEAAHNDLIVQGLNYNQKMAQFLKDLRVDDIYYIPQ